MSSVAFDGQAYADSWCDEFSIKSYRDKLMEAGAQGLVGKENADQLAQIIMRMCNGEVMEGFETPALANLRISREAETAPSLTVREEQIISLCAEGMLDREIAERLGISKPPSASICKVF
ncbi:MAG: LuxR C-terminal-related transcriptional regulator [Bifidobacterium sp.]